jgi:hypothetical protein
MTNKAIRNPVEQFALPLDIKSKCQNDSLINTTEPPSIAINEIEVITTNHLPLTAPPSRDSIRRAVARLVMQWGEQHKALVMEIIREQIL